MGDMADYYSDIEIDRDWERHFAMEREALAESQQERREEHRRMHAEDARFLDEFYPDEGSQSLEREHDEDWQDGQPAPVGLGQPWLKGSEIEPFLHQTKHWRNQENRQLPLEEIDGRYAANILGFLERKAPELLQSAANYQSYVECMIDEITAGPERMAQEDPVAWMKSQPLYKALAAKVAW